MNGWLGTLLFIVGGMLFGAAIGLVLRALPGTLTDSDWLFWALILATPVLWLAAFVFRRQRRHGRISLDKSA